VDRGGDVAENRWASRHVLASPWIRQEDRGQQDGRETIEARSWPAFDPFSCPILFSLQPNDRKCHRACAVRLRSRWRASRHRPACQLPATCHAKRHSRSLSGAWSEEAGCGWRGKIFLVVWPRAGLIKPRPAPKAPSGTIGADAPAAPASTSRLPARKWGEGFGGQSMF
jgi:hypothetical protein